MKQIIVTTFAAGLALLILMGCSSLAKTSQVKDPLGRFSFAVSDDLVERESGDNHYSYDNRDPDLRIDIVAREAGSESEGLKRAFQAIGTDLTDLDLDGESTLGDWTLERFTAGDNGSWLAVAYQYRGGTLYAFFVAGGADADPESLPPTVFVSLRTFAFTELAGEVYRPSTYDELEEYVDGITAAGGGAVSVAVLKDNELVYTYASGTLKPGVPVDDRSLFQWGSITKLITAVAVMQQVEAGRVELDAPLSTYLPELPFGDEITVRNALTHSSGLPDREVNQLIAYGPYQIPELEKTLAEYIPSVKELRFTPGSKSAYNNWNFLLLGVIVERITGMELTEYTRSHILVPARMTESWYRWSVIPAEQQEARAVISEERRKALSELLEENGLESELSMDEQREDLIYLHPFDILPCWGGMKSSSRDAVRFASIFLNRGVSGGNRILEKSSVREMLSVQKSIDGDPLPFGLGIQLEQPGRKPVAGHGGGGPGIESYLRFYTRSDLAIAVLGTMNGYGAEALTTYAYDIANQ